jgi:hyperosmotically inducible protein
MKTDRKLKEDVEEELDWTPDVNSTGIGVEVEDGVVTLSGHPSSYSEKLAAEKAVQRVAGVKAVVIEMEVRLPHSDVRNDVDIASAADTILRWTVGLREGAVKVQVEKGWVTLRGHVDWAYQSQVAARRIAHMRGVTGVTNLIEVRARVAAGDVGEKIGRALQRHAEREAKHIAIEVQNGTVTLAGKVGTYSERMAARGAAWSAPGVHAVVDNLEVQ